MAVNRRDYGSGRLYVRADARGRESFYGTWYTDGRRMKRRIGLKRPKGSGEGLTITDAEKRLRELMASEAPPAAGDRLTLKAAGESYRAHLAATGKPKTGQKRKPATLKAVESTFRVWLDPILGDLTLDKITSKTVRELMQTMEEQGVGSKSIRNYIGTLSALYRYAMHPSRRWARENPVEAVELPALERSTEIRFLSVQDVQALASAAGEGDHQALDRALYLTAAMTGLRQGELLALRWQDVDWQARRIRVGRSHVLGEFGTPKSHRQRSVPLGIDLAGELDAWHKLSAWKADSALVFAEPDAGGVLRRGALMRRYRRALTAAKLPAHRFHDLRHTFGTQMAKSGVAMRTLQEFMGHEDARTTLIYAHYAESPAEIAMVDRAFADPLGRGSIRGSKLSQDTSTQGESSPANMGLHA
jgi:integrase